VKLELAVKGMTCGGCEMHVEKAAMSIGGIVKADADHGRGLLSVRTQESLEEEDLEKLILQIKEKVGEAGYTVEGLFKGSSDSFSRFQWLGILVILAALVMIVKQTGIMNALPVLNSTMGYGLLFVIGLMTSVHCIGMCGGINLTVSLSSVRRGEKQDGLFKRARPALLYNGGRVVSYTLVGALAGTLGSVVSITGTIQGIIVGLAGLFMIIMGANMLGLLTGLSRFLPRMPKNLTAKIHGLGTNRGPFIVGFLNGFMPCGPLQSVQIYALGTGSTGAGALSMFLFSLGTVPLMLGFGSITTLLPRHFHSRILKVSALLVLLLGGGMVLRGMSLNGISPLSAGLISENSENVRIAALADDGKQYVTTIMHGDEYEPFIVQAGIPVVWTINADEAELNGCNNPLTVPEYGIRFTMKPGENVIEFTPPAKPGIITYTCWMGMITSGIKVVEDLAAVDSSSISDAAALAAGSEGGCSGTGEGTGGCCGSSSGAGGGISKSELSAFFANPIPDIDDSEIALAFESEGVQIVETRITKDGFEPAVIVVKRGVPVNWVFSVEEMSEETGKAYFPAYGYQGVEFSEGANSLNLIPEFDFTWYSWKNDFGGYVKVVDDLNSVNPDEVRRDVQFANDQN